MPKICHPSLLRPTPHHIAVFADADDEAMAAQLSLLPSDPSAEFHTSNYWKRFFQVNGVLTWHLPTTHPIPPTILYTPPTHPTYHVPYQERPDAFEWYGSFKQLRRNIEQVSKQDGFSNGFSVHT